VVVIIYDNLKTFVAINECTKPGIDLPVILRNAELKWTCTVFFYSLMIKPMRNQRGRNRVTMRDGDAVVAGALNGPTVT